MLDSGVTAGGAVGHSASPGAALRENQPTNQEKRGVVKKKKRRGKEKKGRRERKERRKRKGKRRKEGKGKGRKKEGKKEERKLWYCKEVNLRYSSLC